MFVILLILCQAVEDDSESIRYCILLHKCCILDAMKGMKAVSCWKSKAMKGMKAVKRCKSKAMKGMKAAKRCKSKAMKTVKSPVILVWMDRVHGYYRQVAAQSFHA